MITSTEAIDKSGWGDGPWQTEPDRVEFEAHGFPCLVLRVASHGGLCGYVAVPPGHPWHGKDYNDVEADAHGGLTYAGACEGSVCHVPKPGEPDNVWWFGFDHAHGGDLSPAYRRLGGIFSERCGDLSPAYRRLGGIFSERGEDQYRTVEYARNGCIDLAAQAAAAEVTTHPAGTTRKKERVEP